jgi:hypothetical protein
MTYENRIDECAGNVTMCDWPSLRVVRVERQRNEYRIVDGRRVDVRRYHDQAMALANLRLGPSKRVG